MSAETTTTNIALPFPEVVDCNLRIALGACKLKVSPGAATPWVAGTYVDRSNALPPLIQQEGGEARIMQNYQAFNPLGLFTSTPQIDLTLGTAQPYSLGVELGASDNTLELGGLPLTRLSIKQGAGKVDVNFSSANPQPMSLLRLEAGATGMEMRNLANANFTDMILEGGAAGYKFDFGGTLQRNAHVRLTAGVSGVEITVPATTAAKIRAEIVLGGLSIGDGFTKKDGAFWTEAALKGQTPVLVIDANLSLGGLTLKVV
jgi:hypothetical protein